MLCARSAPGTGFATEACYRPMISSRFQTGGAPMNAAEVEPVQTVYANADKQVVARILVVDDNKSIRFLLRNVLEPEGFEVVEAENGSDGLLRYQVEPTDLVITDMQMPVMGGLAMMRELQRTFPY